MSNANPSPDSRFVMVPRRPHARMFALLLAVAWLLSLGITADGARRLAAPQLDDSRTELNELRKTLDETLAANQRLRQRVSVLKRSDQVSRNANRELQLELASRDTEVAQLRSDVAFYERLVGGTGQRQGLTVHSLNLHAAGEGAFHYTLTLTQNLKKAKVSKGEVTLRVDGVRQGKLSTLDWPQLVQAEKPAPLDFAFKYFQQLEGSLMLPADFTPHRVRVRVRSEGVEAEQSFPWQSAIAQGA